MKLGVWSDLHLELYEPHEVERFLFDIPPADVMVLAGDIAGGPYLSARLQQIAARYPHTVYVHGNHEFYYSTREATIAATKKATAASPTLSWLDCSVTTVGDVRFVGTPLWFRKSPTMPEAWLTDFQVIDGYRDWVYEENARALAFLEETVQPGDVVVTHHLPAPGSVAARFRGDPSNAFFLCDVGPLILDKQPRLWIHGHTHTPCDYQIGETRVVCNPRGYPGEAGTRFKKFLTVEV